MILDKSLIYYMELEIQNYKSGLDFKKQENSKKL